MTLPTGKPGSWRGPAPDVCASPVRLSDCVTDMLILRFRTPSGLLTFPRRITHKHVFTVPSNGFCPTIILTQSSDWTEQQLFPILGPDKICESRDNDGSSIKPCSLVFCQKTEPSSQRHTSVVRGPQSAPVRKGQRRQFTASSARGQSKQEHRLLVRFSKVISLIGSKGADLSALRTRLRLQSGAIDVGFLVAYSFV